MEYFLITATFGLGVGLMIGMTGMGGAALMTPLLILTLGVKPVTAIGTDITYAAITKTVGGWRHLKLKNVKIGLALWLALGSVPGGIAGVWLIQILKTAYGNSVDKIAMMMIAGALLVLGCALLIRALFNGQVENGEREKVSLDRRHKVVAVALGIVTGLAVGITSVGSGTLVAVLLIVVYKLAPRQVVGTDVFHAALLLWAAGLAHFSAGNVDVPLLLSILAGSIPGVWIGSHLTVKLPTGFLRTAISVLMVSSGVALLQKAGLGIPPTVLIGLPAALAISAILMEWVRSRRAKVAPATAPAPATAAVNPNPARLTAARSVKIIPPGTID